MPIGPLNRLLFFPPTDVTYSVSSWPGELCCLRGVVCRALPYAGGTKSPLLSEEGARRRVRKPERPQRGEEGGERESQGGGGDDGDHDHDDYDDACSFATANANGDGGSSEVMESSPANAGRGGDRDSGRAEGAPYVLIFCHGNSSDLGTLDHLEQLRDGLGVHVIAVEYPGFGLAKGSAHEASVDAAARKVYWCLVEDLGWEPSQIILMGRSVGCGPVLKLASEWSPGAVILVSPFTSVTEMAHLEVGLPKPFLRFILPDRWNNKRQIAQVSSPTFVAHGDKDRVVPFQHGVELFELSGARQKYIAMLEGIGHADISWNQLIESPMLSFLKKSFDDSASSLRCCRALSLPRGCFRDVAQLDKNCIPAQIEARSLEHCSAKIVEIRPSY